MRRLVVVAALVSLPALPVKAAQGQWTVGLELGAARFGGSAHDTSNGSGPPRWRPGDVPTIGLRLERGLGRFRVVLKGSYGKPGLSALGQGLTVTDKSSGQLIEVATLVAVRVGGIGPSGAVRAEIGPALHLWKFGDDMHSGVGALGALAYEWPVVGRFSGAIRLEGTLSKSWFEEGDLPPEYDLRMTWRYGMTVGLRWRL
jgi:hypothetical protein